MTIKHPIMPTLCLLAMTAAALATENRTALQTYADMCRENAHCSSKSNAEGLHITLNHDGRKTRLLCQADGSCFRLLSRGQRQKMADIQHLLGG